MVNGNAGADSFDRYEADHAPALRTDGMARFGSIPGVLFERSVGEIVG